MKTMTLVKSKKQNVNGGEKKIICWEVNKKRRLMAASNATMMILIKTPHA